MAKKAFLHARVDIPLLFISVVVYVIFMRMISLRVQKSFAFLCIPSLYRRDFHTST